MGTDVGTNPELPKKWNKPEIKANDIKKVK
jgi:hypothetical protein